METVRTVLIIIGIIMMLLAAFKVPESRFFSWFPMGVALWAIGMSVSIVVSVSAQILPTVLGV